MPFPGMFGRSDAVDAPPPKGFRTVTMTQGLIEFAQPLMERLQAENAEAMNIGMNLATQIWNFNLTEGPVKASRDDVIDQISDAFGLDETDAIDLFDEMLERKTYLFPQDIQPDNPMTMFMRKEVEYLIAKFDESQLELSDTPIPPDQEDQKMLAQLQQLDENLEDGAEYDDWEDLYFKVEEDCCQRYNHWLRDKGAPAKQCREFPFCVEVFLNYVYRYTAGTVDGIDYMDLEEFFLDHVLRKVVIQPSDYVYWPPALRLFYQFLGEKGYLEDPRDQIDMLHEIEPEFLETLKRRY